MRIFLAILALLCLTGSPVVEVAACPILNAQSHQTHPCCPKPKPVTAPACVTACSAATVDSPVWSQTPAAFADLPATAAITVEWALSVPVPRTLDPATSQRDLHLELGVIRR